MKAKQPSLGNDIIWGIPQGFTLDPHFNISLRDLFLILGKKYFTNDADDTTA